MKTSGYVILAFISLFAFTPKGEIKEIKILSHEDLQSTSKKDIDSLTVQYEVKKDSLEELKSLIIKQQIEDGIRN